MRSLLLAALLLNLLAFAYQHWIIEPASPVDALSLEQGFPRLQVLAPAVVAPPADPDPQPAAPRCLRIGPFLRADAADKVRQKLTQRGAIVQQTASEGEVWVGHWVQVEIAGGRAQAEAARDRLKAAGVGDAYIVSVGATRRISLGVYRLLSSANAVVDKARKLGFEPLVTERFQPGTNFWLSARLAPDQRLDGGDLTGAGGQIVRSEAVPCSEESS